MVIDLYGLTEKEVLRDLPSLYQHVVENVKPERDQNRNPTVRQNWWIHGMPKVELRKALHGLHKYVVTTETSKHRFFTTLDARVLPDNKLIVFPIPDDFFLGVLSSAVHVYWSEVNGSKLGIGNDWVYSRTTCFETFPFPTVEGELRARIAELAEQIDSHRKQRQEQHSQLKITDLYNVLDKLRSGDELSAREQLINSQGLVSVLRQLHDDLDRAVLEAYGWSDLIALLDDPSRAEELEQALLERLVALNAERAAEEKQGLVRWLRPEYQNPGGGGQEGMSLPASVTKVASTEKVEKEVWPEGLKERLMVVRGKVASFGGAVSVSEIAAMFKGVRKGEVEEILESLEGLGQVRSEAQRYFLQ